MNIDTIRQMAHDMISGNITPSEDERVAQFVAACGAVPEEEREGFVAQMYAVAAQEMLDGVRARLAEDPQALGGVLVGLRGISDVEFSVDEVLAMGMWWAMKGSDDARKQRLADEFDKMRNGLVLTMPRLTREIDGR
jgi:hypothetical protein